jgi:FKBP-type peptidyl-prolyl cis-trans isomerase
MDAPSIFAPGITTLAPAAGADFEKLEIEDVVVGKGPQGIPSDVEKAKGTNIEVHYTGTFVDGKQFDSSVGRDPFSFSVGRGQVIAGWDQGLLGMKVGGKRKLKIPSALAYGAQGAGTVIPPNSPLLFEVELIKSDRQ